MQVVKLRLTTIGTLSLLFTILASAQTPPIKMGLWQEEVTTTITGIPGVSPTPQIDQEQSCISPESWSKYGLQATNANRCTVSNLHQDSHKMSYDVSCGTQEHGTLVFHMEILIDNDQHMHGTAVAAVTSPNPSSGAATWTSILTEHYIGPDCGSLKPGEKKPVDQTASP
jgi:hypothetical protein